MPGHGLAGIVLLLPALPPHFSSTHILLPAFLSLLACMPQPCHTSNNPTSHPCLALQVPLLRTVYRRTAFQKSSDNVVRISMDTHLQMIRELGAARTPGDWCRWV